MTDVLFSMAWQCGERGCSADGGWHMSTYWMKGRGYTVDNYSDGDHEEVSKKMLPSQEEVDASWLRYSEWVAKHGKDPLDNFINRGPALRKEARFVAEFVDSISGPLLVSLHGWRRPYATRFQNARLTTGRGDADLVAFLLLEKRGTGWVYTEGKRLSDIPDFEDSFALSSVRSRRIKRKGMVVRVRLTFTLEVERPDWKERLARHYKAAARKHLREAKRRKSRGN